MDNKELDKLRILAANGRDFYSAVLTKLRDRAINNNHDMTEYDEERRPTGTKSYMIDSVSYCRKCPFQLNIEFMNTEADEKVYVQPIDTDVKCDEQYHIRCLGDGI